MLPIIVLYFTIDPLWLTLDKELTKTEVFPFLPKLRVLIIPFVVRPDLNDHIRVVREMFECHHAIHTPGLRYIGSNGCVYTYRYHNKHKDPSEGKMLEVYELCERESCNLDSSVAGSTWLESKLPERGSALDDYMAEKAALET